MRLITISVLFLIFSTSFASAQETPSDVIVTVDSTNLRFNPSEITIQEGQAIRFVWGGQALPHNAVADDGVFDSGEPARDVDYRIVFEVGTAGSYRFVCEPHESVGMVGQLIVEPAPVIVEEEEEEEEPEVEKTPAVSMLSSILVLLVAVVRRRSEEY